MAFVTLKGLRVVYIPGPLVSHKPQFLALFTDSAHDGCGLDPCGLMLMWWLIERTLRNSSDSYDNGQRQKDESKGFHGQTSFEHS
jgi:hypothetical protein